MLQRKIFEIILSLQNNVFSRRGKRKEFFYNYLHKRIEALILHSKTMTAACKTLYFPVRPFINASCGKLKPD